MKRISIYSILLAVVTMLFSSCSGFLAEHPKDKISEEDAYATPMLVYLTAVASLYTQVGANGGGNGLQGTDRGLYDLNTFTSDEAMIPTRGGDWYDGGLWSNLFLHNWGTNNDLFYSSWLYLYRVIVLANTSIDKMQSILDANPDNTAIPPYIAEVRAFRAMYYYYLVDLFGRVPLVTSSKTEMSEVEQSERKMVYDFCIKELQETVGELNNAHSNLSGEYYGRMTQPVAYFLLAKLMLNAEIYSDNDWTDGVKPDGKTMSFNVDGQSMNAWEACQYYCNKITGLGYSLESNFAANFSTKNESSVENIYIIPMDPTLYTNEFYYLIRSRHYNQGLAYGQGGWNGSSATKEALDAFGYNTASQDPRFAMTYYAGTVAGPDGQPIKLDDGKELIYVPEAIKLNLSGDLNEKTAGARMFKYELDVAATNDGKLQTNDIVLYRYADVLLMLAEAKVRNGESGTAEVNQVRSRAGAASIANVTLADILDERMRELAWEGHRRQDMIRFGTFTEAYTDRPQLPGESDGYTTVFPLEERVLSVNTKLTQNPGY